MIFPKLNIQRGGGKSSNVYLRILLFAKFLNHLELFEGNSVSEQLFPSTWASIRQWPPAPVGYGNTYEQYDGEPGCLAELAVDEVHVVEELYVGGAVRRDSHECTFVVGVAVEVDTGTLQAPRDETVLR